MDDSTKIFVAARCRPRLPKLGEAYEVEVCQKVDDTTLLLSAPTTSAAERERNTTFSFDAVFDSNSSQEDIYEECVAELVDQTLDGHHVTIFTYGQTGSGKTYTVLGDMTDWKEVAKSPKEMLKESTGLFLRALIDLFSFKRKNPNINIKLELSILEIYNETFRDLLGEPGDPPVLLKDVGSEVVVQNCRRMEISSIADAYGYFQVGNKHRVTTATSMNDRSSRSHAVFLIDIKQDDPAHKHSTSSRLTLVDLAGSERVKRSGVEGDRLKEAQYINKSLSALGLVVNALHTGKSHVPYRDSKLTRLLKNSLSIPECKVLLIANMSPVLSSMNESISTLRFADRLKGIKVDQIMPSAAEREAEMEYMTALKSHQQVAMEMKIARDVFDYENQLSDVSVNSENFESAFRERLLFCKRNASVIKETKEKEKEQSVVTEVEEGIRKRAEHEEEQVKVLETKAEELREKEKTLSEAVEKKKSDHDSELDTLYAKLREAQKEKAAAETELENAKTELSHAEKDATKWQSTIETREKEIQAEFQEWTNTWEEEARAWKEEEFNWELERRLWDAFAKIQKGRRLLYKRHQQGEDLQRQVKESTVARDEVEPEWIAGWILSDVLRSALAEFPDELPEDLAREEEEITQRDQQEFEERRKIFENETLLFDIIKYLQHGCMMVKHGRTGRPHVRAVFITEDEKAIGWGEVGKDGMVQRKSSNTVRFADVTDMILGQYTKTFLRHRSSTGHEDFYLSFSLIWGKKTFDVVAESQADFEAWLMALMALLPRHVIPHFGGGLDLTRWPGYELLDEDEKDLCSKFHITPLPFLNLKEYVETNLTPEDALSLAELRALTEMGMQFIL
eukprot:TRINITY_DN1899_c0_g1_i4.p1 TRINITY_DN1899_c0_g1~~TRINITY_DN1899_c0_g1_i4.p1  ORF type:complete len:851 (+),score=282.44 TRINITY_DN1899_c0_g1_i4:165-2717(+)